MQTKAEISYQLESLLSQIAHELQLPDLLHSRVHEHYEALARYLSEGPLAPLSPDLYPQGSYRLGTTTKPVRGEEFDLDFIVELNMPVSAGPHAVFELVASEIERNGRYDGKTERRPSCIRISYANEFHVDVVPAVPDVTAGGTAILIPQQTASGLRWHRTNPKGYARWFETVSVERTGVTRRMVEPLPATTPAAEKTALQVSVQLLKRHHQLHVEDETLRTPSVVLTTIAGLEAGGFSSVADSMNTIAEQLPGYAGEIPIEIVNPAAPYEIITDKWVDGRVFEEFRAQVGKFVTQWYALTGAQGEGYDVIAQLLNQMFGEEPVHRAMKVLGERTGELSKAAALATGAGGVLTRTSPGEGNPRKTFYGNG